MPWRERLTAHGRTHHGFPPVARDAGLTVPVPEILSLLGEVVFSQFVLVDLPANALGLVTTNGVAAEVRW